MRKILIGMLLCIPLLAGCPKEKAKVVPEEPIVPTGQERRMLEIHNLSVDSEAGQRRLRKMRENAAKIEAAQERMRAWAEVQREKEEEEARFNE